MLKSHTKANIMSKVAIKMFMLLLLIISCLKFEVHAGNILVLLPHYGYSHFKVYYPILQKLAEKGHRLTVITHIPNPNPHPNYRELLLGGKETINAANIDEFTPGRSLKILFMEYLDLHYEGQESCEIFYKSGHVEKVLDYHAKRPFDLILTEYFNSDCQMGVAYMMQLPVVGMSSCALMPWFFDRILLPDLPSHVQSEFIGFNQVLGLQDRMINFIQSRGLKLLYR